MFEFWSEISYLTLHSACPSDYNFSHSCWHIYFSWILTQFGQAHVVSLNIVVIPIVEELSKPHSLGYNSPSY